MPNQLHDNEQPYIKDLVVRLKLSEKAALWSGKNFWMTKDIPRLGIPSITVSDGPHGLRKPDHQNPNRSQPATCFPTASALASSWNTDLLEHIGVALGQECQASDVQVLLGPGINMKRSPLAGRNFEFFAEDPVLAGQLAARYIQGVQSQGIGVSLKHFVANNQEFERMTNSSEIDEQTLHEIYLPAFETAVREAQPWSVMMSYNKLNGVYSTENPLLMQTLLRDEWGYRGITISDWGAVDDPLASVRAGLNLEMPGINPASQKSIIRAVKDGSLDENVLNDRVTELLEAIFNAHNQKKLNTSFDKTAHHQLAHRAAAESIVLLKNTGGLLPLEHAEKGSIAIIGRFAKIPRYQGSGSSRVHPTKLSNTSDALQTILGTGSIAGYAEGYLPDGSTTPKLLDEAIRLAAKAKTVLLFAGLPRSYESEGFDRQNINLPDGHNQLIEAITAANKRVVVVLMNGSAVAMPWIRKVPAVLEGWLGGQAAGEALADIITGRINPSGKLSETFPVRIEDTPPYPDFPGKGGTAFYREGSFIGYRHYDARKIKPLFAFGHGLSYTEFTYKTLSLSKDTLTVGQELAVKVTLQNTGKQAGQEVVQLYLFSPDPTRPPKALKAFTKISLASGEVGAVNFTLTERDFAVYDTTRHSWRVYPGNYHIGAGGSSEILPLQATVLVKTDREQFPELTHDSMVKEFAAHPRGKLFYRLISKRIAGQLDPQKDKDAPSPLAMLQDVPVSRLVAMSQGVVSQDFLDAILTYCRYPGSPNPLHVLPLIKATVKLVVRQALGGTKHKQW